MLFSSFLHITIMNFIVSFSSALHIAVMSYIVSFSSVLHIYYNEFYCFIFQCSPYCCDPQTGGGSWEAAGGGGHPR